MPAMLQYAPQVQWQSQLVAGRRKFSCDHPLDDPRRFRNLREWFDVLQDLSAGVSPINHGFDQIHQTYLEHSTA